MAPYKAPLLWGWGVYHHRKTMGVKKNSTYPRGDGKRSDVWYHVPKHFICSICGVTDPLPHRMQESGLLTHMGRLHIEKHPFKLIRLNNDTHIANKIIYFKVALYTFHHFISTSDRGITFKVGIESIKHAYSMTTGKWMNPLPQKLKCQKIDGWKMTFPCKFVPFQGTCEHWKKP